MKEQFAHINQMENILNNTDILIKEMEILIKKWKENQVDFQNLMNYYGSEEWFKDRKDDEEHKIPKDSTRGVLGEDAVYDTYGNWREVALKMIKTGATSLE